MAIEWIDETAPRCTLAAHAAEKWQFVRVSRGWVARAWIDVNALDADERAEYEEQEAMELSWARRFSDAHIEVEEPETIWPSLALAKEFAALMDAARSIGEDMHAMCAPGECYETAHRESEARYEALMAQAVQR